MAVSKIVHQGKKVIIVDYSECKRKGETIEVLLEAEKCFFEETDKHLLILFDYTNSYVNSDFLKKAKEMRVRLLASKTVKSAALGIVGIKKILLKAYNSMSGKIAIMPLDSKEEALDYLVS